MLYADFRGRIYTLTQYLSYQGDDMVRSLLLFYPTKDITNKSINENASKYLYIYFANLAGQTNLSFADRIAWSKNNIIDIFENYVNNKDTFNTKYLTSLKEPLQFISIMLAIIDYLNAQKEGTNITINNPILFDASCNGIQHLSALTREIDTAIKVNLVKLNKEDTDVPQDYYLYAGQLVQEALDKSENAKINRIKLTRKMIKLTVMTIPYNISVYGVIDQMKSHFIEIKENTKLFYKIPAELTKDNSDLFFFTTSATQK